MIGVLLRLIYNVTIFPLVLLIWTARRAGRLQRPQPLRLRLTKIPAPLPAPRFRRSLATLDELGRHLDAAAAHPRVTGLLLVLDGLSGGLPDFAELGALVDRFRKSRKPLHVHLEQADWPTLVAVAPADRITVAPAGSLMLHGLGIELLFVGEMLARHGVRLEVIQRGEYKGVMEPFVRREPSPQLAESIRALVESLHDEVAARLAGRPGWDLARARAALNEGPHTLQNAMHIGLLDAAGLPDEAETTLASAGDAARPGAADRPLTVALRDPAKGARPKAARPIADSTRVGLVRPRPARIRPERLIACVPVAGLILDRAMGGVGRRRAAIAARIAPRLRRLADSARVAAIVLVIDSRGGTVSGSDRIWDAARYALGRKPVIAWMRGYAASGGYYVAAATQHIVASPFTITGSIGVVASKPNLAEAAARLGVNAVAMTQGQGAVPFSPFRPFDELTLTWMHARVGELYERFTGIVAEGRRLPVDAVEAVARGRVWTGPQAHERRLVDQIGHYEDVLAAARAQAGLKERAGKVVWVSPPEGLLRRLQRFAQAGGHAGVFDAALDPAMELVTLTRESQFLYYCPPVFHGW